MTKINVFLMIEKLNKIKKIILNIILILVEDSEKVVKITSITGNWLVTFCEALWEGTEIAYGVNL